VFDALHPRGRVTDAILQAFDLLELDGVDYRPLPLGERKTKAGGAAGAGSRRRLQSCGRCVLQTGWSARRLPSIALINLTLGDGRTRMAGENSGWRQ